MFETELIYARPDKSPFSLLKDMYVEKGSSKDWELWHELHYKSGKMSAGSRCYRIALNDEPIGIVIMALSKPLLKEKNRVLPKIKAGNDTKITNTHRFNWTNSNILVVSRVVLDPIYRSVGVGYRATNLVSRMCGMRLVEIQSSMSKFNPFAQKAGFRFAKPMSSTMFDQGIRFFRTHFESAPEDSEALLQELEKMPPRLREKTLNACKSWYFRHSPLEKVGNNAERGLIRTQEMSAREAIKALQQLVVASPLYGIYKNPDHGNILPDKIPLSAFDNQPVDHPLRLGLL